MGSEMCIRDSMSIERDRQITASEISRSYWDSMSPEARSEAMRRRWVTRRANAEKRRREAEGDGS